MPDYEYPFQMPRHCVGVSTRQALTVKHFEWFAPGPSWPAPFLLNIFSQRESKSVMAPLVKSGEEGEVRDSFTEGPKGDKYHQLHLNLSVNWVLSEAQTSAFGAILWSFFGILEVPQHGRSQCCD